MTTINMIFFDNSLHRYQCIFRVKQKTSRSESQGEEELGESDVIPQKAKAKAKKKKGPGKGKKRTLSTAADFEDYEPSKLSRRVRSKSRQTVRRFSL